MAEYLSGGEQTTINSTITELYPTLAFNNKLKFSDTQKFQNFIMSLAETKKLFFSKSKLSFVNEQNSKDAIELINNTTKIRPNMLKEKLSNAIGVLNYIYEQDKIRPIEKVVWGYREKPKGVSSNHAGDIFIFFKSNAKPKILGVSLKAGSEASKEPKLNSYVRTTLTKPYWKRSLPSAEVELKQRLWENCYSKLSGLNKNKVNQSNWLTLSNTQKPDPMVVNAVLRTFKTSPKKFDELYAQQNKQSKLQLIKMINRDLTATKEWIENEFRLEKPKSEVEVPLILVKAVGSKATEQGDKLAKIFPKITAAKAYLNPSSVQEWFIDVFSGKEKLTLLMTIRSDSEYREEKQKGKLGAYMQLKLLYRGYK